jgi:hypothetical protein
MKTLGGGELHETTASISNCPGCRRSTGPPPDIAVGDVDEENFPSGSPWIKRTTLSTKYGWQSTEGYTHDGRLIGRGARNQEPG